MCRSCLILSLNLAILQISSSYLSHIAQTDVEGASTRVSCLPSILQALRHLRNESRGHRDSAVQGELHPYLSISNDGGVLRPWRLPRHCRAGVRFVLSRALARALRADSCDPLGARPVARGLPGRRGAAVRPRGLTPSIMPCAVEPQPQHVLPGKAVARFLTADGDDENALRSKPGQPRTCYPHRHRKANQFHGS
jgi:hypothetical protein